MGFENIPQPGYQPSEEEMKEAQNKMTHEQKVQSGDREQLHSLREMGEAQFGQRTQQLPLDIIEVSMNVKDALVAYWEKELNGALSDEKHLGSASTSAEEIRSYLREIHETLLKMENYSADENYSDGTLRPRRSIHFSTEFDPKYPVTLRGSYKDESKRGLDNTIDIHWSMWRELRRSLSPEVHEFIRLVRYAQELSGKFSNYTETKRFIEDQGLDPQAPSLFR